LGSEANESTYNKADKLPFTAVASEMIPSTFDDNDEIFENRTLEESVSKISSSSTNIDQDNNTAPAATIIYSMPPTPVTASSFK
jgi:hypothetical protein